MEEEKKLYPFRFCSLQDDYGWGSEEFKLADLGYRDSLVREGWLAGNAISEVMDMYMDRVVGEAAFGFWGRQFPVQAKLITVSGKMPLRVHPDDETAAERYDFLGKEKLWYVVSAGKDASLMIGFRSDTDASAVYGKCMDGSIDSLLNTIAPKAGECYRIAPGTPHAASGNVRILEISESSPLDFCMCGWGAEVSTEEFDPALTVVDALDFINYRAYPVENAAKGDVLADIPQFKVTRMQLKEPLMSRSAQYDSFIIYSCVKGEAEIQMDLEGVPCHFQFKDGDTMLVPAECPDFTLVPKAEGTVLLETTLSDKPQSDPYINPDAAPTLPEDKE